MTLFLYSRDSWIAILGLLRICLGLSQALAQQSISTAYAVLLQGLQQQQCDIQKLEITA